MSDKKIDNTENNSEYNLYTEHIVDKPWKNIRKNLKKGLVLLAMAIVFGLVAGLVMVIVYKGGRNYVDKKTPPISTTAEPSTEETKAQETTSETESDSENGETITIAPIESGETKTENESETIEPDDNLLQYGEYYESLRKVTEDTKSSMVKVTVSKEKVDWFNSTYQNITDEYGLVISKDSTGYFILTDYTMLKNAGDIVVTYIDGTTDTAVFVAGDATTNIAVIKTSTADKDVKIATLGSANSLKQGDPVIAIGNLYGFAGASGYGMATGVDITVNDTDSSYKLITTSIVGNSDSTGIITNLQGEIVGIITMSYNSGSSNFVTGYSVNDVRKLIEQLGNGKSTAYFGIKGQEVTEKIKTEYGIPNGIYISAVEAKSPAYQAGIQTGDVIYRVNDTTVNTMQEFMTQIRKCSPDTMTRVMIKRKGRDSYKEIEFNLILVVK